MIPNDFYTYQAEYDSLMGQDQEVVDYFTAGNITLYENTWAFNKTRYGGAETLPDVPVVDHQLEFHWEFIELMEVRHAFPTWFFGFWLDYERMELIEPDWSRTPGYPISDPANIYKDDLLALERDENASSFTVECEHVIMSFVVMNNGTYANLEAAYDAGEVRVLASYDIDFAAMKPSAFTLLGQLVTFQNPDLGIPGDFGDLLNYGFGVGFWIIIAIAVYTLVTRLLPTIQGGVEN